VVVKITAICFTSGKEHKYQLHRRLDGPPVLAWTSQRNEKSLVPAGIQIPDHPAHSLVTIRIMLSQLRVYIILMSKSKIKSRDKSSW